MTAYSSARGGAASPDWQSPPPCEASAMNIPSVSSTSIAALPSASGANPVSSPQDPDGDGQVHVHHGGHHRGGAVGSAMMAALQSLGLSLPQPSASGSSNSGSASTGQDSAGTASVGHDVRQVMHALFEAVRGEPAGATTSSGSATAGTSSGGPSSFASGLSALITQVANGSAPADLQSAFSQLVQDAGVAGAAGNANASLQAFLNQLKANLGYDANSGSGSGNLMATQA